MKRRTGKTPAGKADEPALGHALIPKERYISPAFMELEWERMWTKVWLMGPRLQDLAAPGDYVCEEVGRESLIFVRTQGDEVRAFYNVCPHRGNRIAHAEFSNAESFTCSFHGWNFATDGELRGISEENTFNPKLIAHRPGLNEVRCDVAAGLIFINSTIYTFGPCHFQSKNEIFSALISNTSRYLSNKCKPVF